MFIDKFLSRFKIKAKVLIVVVPFIITISAVEGRTMLIVTHEMDFARDVSSRTVFLHQGVIAEEGPSSEMFAHPRTERFRQFLRRDGAASH